MVIQIEPPTEASTVPPETPQDEAQFSSRITSDLWTFGLDKVIEGTQHYAPEPREAVRWFYEACRNDNIGMKAAAKLIRYDITTLYRVCMGKYEGNLKNICRAIDSYRELWNERRNVQDSGFIETSIVKDIWRICRNSLKYQAIGLVTGPSQSGKTTALEEFQRRNNHGKTKYLRLPASAGVQLMMKEFATACHISRDCPFETLRERVLRCIDSNHLVVVDEIHQAFATYQRGARMKVIECIREIYDRTKCGMVLCGTPIFEKEMEEGNLKELLEQMDRRCIFRLNLTGPEKMPERDINAHAASFGLKPPDDATEEMIREILRCSGIGMFVKFLQASSELAANEKHAISWKDFTRAHDIVNKGRHRK